MDLKAKIHELLELTDNLKTGPFGEQNTDYDEHGFKLESQTDSFLVEFDDDGSWRVESSWIDDYDLPHYASESGHGWDSFIDYLHGCDDTFFLFLPTEAESLKESVDNKFEVREEVLNLDLLTDFKFDLANLYDASILDDKQIEEIAHILVKDVDNEEKAKALFDLLDKEEKVYDEDLAPTFCESDICDGDEIVYNGEHLYVVDSNLFDDPEWLWVTDNEEDRYNKKASGWSVKKEWVDEVIGQPKDESETSSLQEAQTDVVGRLRVVEYDGTSGQMWNHTLKIHKDAEGYYWSMRVDGDDYDDDQRYADIDALKIGYEEERDSLNKLNYVEKWGKLTEGCEQSEDLEEALHVYPELAIDEFETFKRLCDKIGLKTLKEVEDLVKSYGKGKDVLTTLKDYLINELGIDFRAKNESLNESITEADKNIIIDAVKGEFETGHGYIEDKDEFEEMMGRRLTPSKYEELKEFYSNLQELGPTGFYEEYKDKLEFDPDFVQEFGGNEISSDWKLIDTKQVYDADGFLTDYSWYENSDGTHVMVFGDSDIYTPDDMYFDMTFDSEEAAREWFDNYKGIMDEDYHDDDVFDIKGKAVAEKKRAEVLDEFNEIFKDMSSGGLIYCSDEEVVDIVRPFLEDKGFTVDVSVSTDFEHPICIEWFREE